jgi:hypothetical protein
MHAVSSEAQSMSLLISQAVRAKLAGKTPPVTESEIIECFANRTGSYLIDTRADNMTNPLTRWFIAETNFGRKIKVVFMPTTDGIVIKTAYPPNETELRIYNKVALPNI